MEKEGTEKYIYLVRHGETEYNRKGYLQGSSINASLNEKGREQAQMFFERFSNIRFDKIYTSVLKRSIESVELFINHGIPWEAFSELNEINWGEMEGKLLGPKNWIKLRKIAKKWSEGKTSEKIDGGESPEDVAARLRRFISIMLSRTEEKNVLICTHGRTMRIFLCILMNQEVSCMDRYNHSNMGLYLIKYVYETGDSQILIKNEFRLMKENKFNFL